MTTVIIKRRNRPDEIFENITTVGALRRSLMNLYASKQVIIENLSQIKIESPPRRSPVKINKTELMAMVDAGKHPTKIAKHFGCHTATVYHNKREEERKRGTYRSREEKRHRCGLSGDERLR